MISFKPVDNPVLTWPLMTPITYVDTKIVEIAIRKPNGLDLTVLGNPIKMNPYNGASDAQVDYAIAYPMLERLSGIPVKVLQSGDPAEFIEIFWAMGTFFTPGLQTTFQERRNPQAPASEPPEPPAS